MTGACRFTQVQAVPLEGCRCHRKRIRPSFAGCWRRSGKRETSRQRTAGQVGIPWISDDWDASAEPIADTYCDPVPVAAGGRQWAVLHRTPGVHLTQAVKHRRRRRLVRVEVRATIGAAGAQPVAVHVERLNGVLRDRLACLTRTTHAFAKDAATWDAASSLALFEHTWLRPHPALRRPLAEPTAGRRYHRRTPAMAIGRAAHPWTWVAFLTHPVSHHAME